MKVWMPFRYRTMEDALTAMNEPDKARELSIPPHVEKDGKIIFNPDYENALFEMGFMVSEKGYKRK